MPMSSYNVQHREVPGARAKARHLAKLKLPRIWKNIPTDVVLDQAKLICGVVYTIADGVVTVPFLKGVAGLAKEVVEIAQIVRSNKDDCRELAQQISEYLSVILGTYGDYTEADVDDKLQNNVSALYRELEDVRSLLSKLEARGRLKRTLLHESDQRRIEGAQKRLQHIFTCFDLANAINVAQDVRKVNANVQDLHREVVGVRSEFRRSAIEARLFFLNHQHAGGTVLRAWL